MDLGIRQLITLTILCLASGLQAEQTVITNYEDARENYFYDRL